MNKDFEVKKLPKRVQSYIFVLESNLESVNNKFLALTSQKVTPISFGRFDEGKKYIDTHSIDIETSQGKFNLTIYPDGRVRIATSTGNLAVMPEACNSISIREVQR
jgi:hypothetical protein